MKSSGNLRLIQNRNLARSITKYYFNTKEVELNKSQTLSRTQAIIELEGKVFNGSVFQQMTDMEAFTFSPPPGNPPLITHDRNLINELIMRLHYVISIMSFTRNYIKGLNQQASALISVLQKQYRLE
jgi:hypothetical protein